MLIVRLRMPTKKIFHLNPEVNPNIDILDKWFKLNKLSLNVEKKEITSF